MNHHVFTPTDLISLDFTINNHYKGKLNLKLTDINKRRLFNKVNRKIIIPVVLILDHYNIPQLGTMQSLLDRNKLWKGSVKIEK